MDPNGMEETVDEKQKAFDQKILTAQPEELPRRLPPKMRMEKGMRIHFYGYSYKVTTVRPNGKITLRFDGHWKDRE